MERHERGFRFSICLLVHVIRNASSSSRLTRILKSLSNTSRSLISLVTDSSQRVWWLFEVSHRNLRHFGYISVDLV